MVHHEPDACEIDRIGAPGSGKVFNEVSQNRDEHTGTTYLQNNESSRTKVRLGQFGMSLTLGRLKGHSLHCEESSVLSTFRRHVHQQAVRDGPVLVGHGREGRRTFTKARSDHAFDECRNVNTGH